MTRFEFPMRRVLTRTRCVRLHTRVTQTHPELARLLRPRAQPGTAALNAATSAKRAGIALITVGVGKATNPGLLKAVATSGAQKIRKPSARQSLLDQIDACSP